MSRVLRLVALAFSGAILSLPACSRSGSGAPSDGVHGSGSSSSGGMGGAAGSRIGGSSSSGSAIACSTLVTTAPLNLRSGPGTTFAVIDVIPEGASVTSLDPTEQNGFYNIAYQTESGWGSASYLEPSCTSSASSGGAEVWSCAGAYGTIPMADGEYYATEFGCYLDANGNPQQDPDDNCIPACLTEAQSSGLCGGMAGPACEDATVWYSADGGRFGCLTRLKVTNQANGKAVVVVVLDFGPACSGEATVHHAAIDLSHAADEYLFGGETGISDKALVHVDVVDAGAALGPVP